MKYLILILMIINLNANGIKLPIAMKADFIQKITNPKKKVLLYKGRVVMDNKSRFKWIYMKPTKKDVCSNGKSVTVVDHDLEQVTFYKLKKSFNLSQILKNAKHYKGQIYTAKYRGKLYTIVLDSSSKIEQIAYRDNMDNIVNIHFENLHTLSKVPSYNIFECKYPNDYDLISG